MTYTDTRPAGTAVGAHNDTADRRDLPARRLSTETKAAFKTTEFFAYIATVIGIIVMANLVGTNDNHADYFRADKAALYIVFVTIGYLVSRGLAKAGSREPYDSH